jgi:hypothetical protein
MKRLATLLTVLFIGLKLTEHITWSWWLVLSPLPIWFVVFEIVIPFLYVFFKTLVEELKK